MEVNNRQIAKNSLWLYVRMLVVTLVSLYTSRVVLHALGIDDFGIYNVAGGVIAFLSVLTTTLSGTTQRFLNVCKGSGDYEGLSRMMNISVRLHVLIGLGLLIIGETVGLYIVDRLLVFPEDRHFAALMVYQASLLTMLFAIFRTPYSSMVIAHERFSFIALLSLLDVTLKLLMAVGLLYVKSDSLVLYGFSFTLIELCHFFFYRLYCRKFYSHQRIEFRELISSNESKGLIKFSSWSLLGGIGTTSANQGITIMLNFFFALSVNAAMGITNQVTNALSSFINNVQLAFRPQLIQSCANNDGSFTYLVCTAAKWSFILMMLICVPIACNLRIILSLWLETVPPYTYHFILILVIFLIIDTLGTPISYGIDATGRVARYQVSFFLLMLLNVSFAWVLCIAGFSPPFIISTKVLTNTIVLLLKLNTLEKNSKEFSIKVFFSQCIGRIWPIGLYGLAVFFISKFLSMWASIVVSTIVYFAGFAFLLLFVSMNESERRVAKQLLGRICTWNS